MELLFARMAPGMRRRATTRVARFAVGSTLPSVAAEVGRRGSGFLLVSVS